MIELNCTKYPLWSSFKHLSNDDTVAGLLVAPVPPFADVITLVMFVFVVAVVTCTDTVITQDEPGAIVPPLKLRLVSPGFGANVPPHPSLAFAGFATIKPAGNASVNATPVNATVVFGLLKVNVSVVVWPGGTTADPNAFAIVGGATTVIVAVLLVPPVPPFADVTALVMLLSTPAAIPVTSTLTVPDPPAGTVPPEKVIVELPAPAVIVPPIVVFAFGVAATFNPAGSVSLKPTPVRATVPFGLLIVNVTVAVPPSGIVGAEKAFVIEGAASTVSVAVLLVAPVPVSLLEIAPVMLFLTPAVTPVTVTPNEQLPPAAIDPPVRAIVLLPVTVSVPPPQVVIVPFGTVNPTGNVSVKLTPVIARVELVLVTVNISEVVPPTGTVAAPNALLIVGGLATVSVAVLLVAPVPPLVELTAPVVLFFTPAVAPVTVTVNVQVPPAATDPPVSEIVFVPVIVNVPPPQVLDVPLTTVRPVGSTSVTATPLSATVAFGFVIVKLRLVVAPNAMFGAPKALLIVGGATTVIVAVLLAVPVPPLAALTAPVVLFLTPAVDPVTVTVIVQVELVAIAPPLKLIVPGAVVVKVPPPQVV